MGRPLAVLGSINVDLVVSGAPLPRPGSTVVGGVFARHQGGKGGNQAVAAARAGAEVAMLGAVGRDPFGAEAVASLQAEGIDTTHVHVAGAATGVALIAVDETGENQITVAPGANARMPDLHEDLEALSPSWVLASCEVPLVAVRSAAAWCREREVPFVLNPAPASAELGDLLPRTSLVTPNAGELSTLAPDIAGEEDRARALAADHPGLSVVVTLGARGAFVVQAGRSAEVPAPTVDVVDSTGAGDCFNGVLTAAWWEGRDLQEAVDRAVVAASISVEAEGAREGMPTRSEIDERVSKLR